MRPPRRKGIRSTRGHRLHAKRAPRSDRIELNLDVLHRHFWRRRDYRDRLPINVGELAESLGVCYDIANAAVIKMRDQGRMRPVAWAPIRVRVYHLADPSEWNPRRKKTHARRATKPRWG